MKQTHFCTTAVLIIGALTLVACDRQTASNAPPPAPVPAAAPAVAPAPPPPPDPLVINAKLQSAAQPFEAITEMAFAAKEADLDSDMSNAESAATQIRGYLTIEDASNLDAQLTNMRMARMNHNNADLALASAEAYRILLGAERGIPEVRMAIRLLDYAGMRYNADLQAKPMRWSDMTDAAAFARAQWMIADSLVTSESLKSDVDKAIGGMETAAKRQQRTAAARSVKSALDLVDKLENQFTSDTTGTKPG